MAEWLSGYNIISKLNVFPTQCCFLKELFNAIEAESCVYLRHNVSVTTYVETSLNLYTLNNVGLKCQLAILQ